jgi:hypothetical protein
MEMGDFTQSFNKLYAGSMGMLTLTTNHKMLRANANRQSASLIAAFYL